MTKMNAPVICPNCEVPTGVLNTKLIRQTRVQYVGGRICGYRPHDNKRVRHEATPVATAGHKTKHTKHKMAATKGATIYMNINHDMQMLMGSPRPLTLHEVAKRYQVNPRTVQRWVELQQFPAPMRNGRTARWSLLQLMHHEARLAGIELTFEPRIQY